MDWVAPVLKTMEFRYAVGRGSVRELDCLDCVTCSIGYFSLNEHNLQVRCANFTMEVNGTCLKPFATEYTEIHGRKDENKILMATESTEYTEK